MRKIKDTQDWLEFHASSNLALTNAYDARYQNVSAVLDRTPAILKLVHKDLESALRSQNRRSERRGAFMYTTEMILRLALCQVIEGASLRGIVVRVDDSQILRRFTRIHDGPMIGHTAFCQLRNAIKSDTWAVANRLLAEAAVENGEITSEKLRLDTTAVETNIHYPTDSSLLWDCYRTQARLIGAVREVAPMAVGSKRVQLKTTKKKATKIARLGKNRSASSVAERRTLYSSLIGGVEAISVWSDNIVAQLNLGMKYVADPVISTQMESLVEELQHYVSLTRKVVWQARERTLEERQVPNDEKLFSIFEDHTELLVRGKAGKNIEFGHMLHIQQTGEKFISDYEVFRKKPTEPALLRLAVESHRSIFGCPPQTLTADRGYWSQEAYDDLSKDVEIVSIPKKGRRTEAETEREHDKLFRLGQAFRAGVEGSISFLKRVLQLGRCMRKGWDHYTATVGATVFAHNLLVLTRC
jgi:IS5 family transposase